jgi:hypothetical protein
LSAVTPIQGDPVKEISAPKGVKHKMGDYLFAIAPNHSQWGPDVEFSIHFYNGTYTCGSSRLNQEDVVLLGKVLSRVS